MQAPANDTGGMAIKMNLYSVCRPSAKGIELIELGGIKPTSVTTAVMLAGGVRSYKGCRISRFGPPHKSKESLSRLRGNDEKR